MSDNSSNNKNVRDDEIDLMELIRRSGSALQRGFNFLIKAILISIVFLIRRWLPLLLSVVIGIAVSYLLKSASSSFFTSDMVVRNNIVLQDKKNLTENFAATSEIISKVNKLHSYCAESNSSALSTALGIKTESVKNITDISSYWIIDDGRDGIPDYVDYKGTHSVYDTLNVRMQNTFDIRVRISTPLDLNDVRDGIIKFIESDTLFQQRNQLRIRQNHDLLARYTYDINQLDSLQKVKYFEETRNFRPGKDGQIVFMQDQKTQLVYGDILTLYEKRQLLETEGELYKTVVTVLSDFSIPTSRENGAMYYGKNLIPLFFCITVLILILLTNKKKIKELFNKY